MSKVDRNYYMMEQADLMPSNIQDGSVYYVKEENGLYIDAFNERNQINPSEVWTVVRTEPTWEKIINNPNYATDYELGMTKDIVMEYDGESEPFIFEVELVAFDTDIRADGDTSKNNGKARMTWICKFVLGQNIMDSEGTEDNQSCWQDSVLYQQLNEQIFYDLPDIFKNNIVDVTKTSSAYNVNDGLYTDTSSNKLWVPSRNEILGDFSQYENDGVTYANYYKGNTEYIKKNSSYEPYDFSDWFLRSKPENLGLFYGIDSNGELTTLTKNDYHGFVFGFCL